MTTGDLAAPATDDTGLTLPRGARRCAPLREGPAWERALRYVLVLLGVAGIAYGAPPRSAAPSRSSPAA